MLMWLRQMMVDLVLNTAIEGMLFGRYLSRLVVLLLAATGLEEVCTVV